MDKRRIEIWGRVIFRGGEGEVYIEYVVSILPVLRHVMCLHIEVSGGLVRVILRQVRLFVCFVLRRLEEPSEGSMRVFCRECIGENRALYFNV